MDNSIQETEKITPEDICLYERKQMSKYQLMQFGVNDLKTSDKLQLLRIKYYELNLTNYTKTLVANRILEEL